MAVFCALQTKLSVTSFPGDRHKERRSPELSARRGFLLKTITLVPAASLVACGATQTIVSTGSPVAGSSPQQSHEIVYSPKYFTAEEWVFINAACARLIPDDETGPGAVETGVPEFIDRQLEGAFGHAARWYTQGPFLSATPEFGYQGKATPREIYRAGIVALDERCRKNSSGKNFAGCEASDTA